MEKFVYPTINTADTTPAFRKRSTSPAMDLLIAANEDTALPAISHKSVNQTVTAQANKPTSLISGGTASEAPGYNGFMSISSLPCQLNG